MENKYCEQCIIDRDKEKCDCKINGGESCPDCYYTSPKEEITANAKEISSGLVNDWESEFEIDKEKFLFFDKSSGSRWLHEKKIKDFIKSVVSSTEKRVAKEIIELLEDKRLEHSESNRDGIELSIDYIKSKYE